MTDIARTLYNFAHAAGYGLRDIRTRQRSPTHYTLENGRMPRIEVRYRAGKWCAECEPKERCGPVYDWNSLTFATGWATFPTVPGMTLVRWTERDSRGEALAAELQREIDKVAD